MQAAITAALMNPLLGIDIERVVDRAIDVHEPDMVDIQRQQLADGQTSQGTAILPFYKPLTVRLRRIEGLQTDHVDLKRKGGFYQGVNARRKGAGKTEIDSSDGKSARLQAKYTVTIFGLSVASRAEFVERMKPTLQTLFKSEMR